MVIDPDPVETLAEILAEHGPLSEDDVLQRLEDAGVPDVDFDDLLDEIGCPAEQLLDDTWVWLPTLLAGRVFTHRVTADEAAHDMLTVTPDLDPVTLLSTEERYGRFTDGSAADVASPAFELDQLEERGIPPESVDINGALLLPPGTLAELGVRPGDVVGVRLTERGFAIEAVKPQADSSVGARLAALVEDDPLLLNNAVWTLCAADPALFTEPSAPLSEIIDGLGLTRRADTIGPAGFDFEQWSFERRCNTLVERHGIEPDEAMAVYGLIQICDAMSVLLESAAEEPGEDLPPNGVQAPEDGDLGEVLGELGTVLADPMIAEVFLAETVGVGLIDPAAMGLFAETLEPKVPRSARVACRWLRGIALERIGDVAAAERELHTAESMDTTWAPVLFDLARFESDRGDAERALSLLRRAGAEPDDPMVTMLEQHRAGPRSDLGRNDPCWCGSGRKYKKCHSGREELPLANRAEWLYSKAVFHVLHTGWRDLLDEVREQRAVYAEDEDEYVLRMSDPLLIDVVLFEGTAFAHFLQERGFLLPEDERLLAEQWLLIDRSVFEIEDVRHGQSVTVRDLRTGDVSEVREVATSWMKAGDLICTRVLPVGDTYEFYGGREPVPLRERDPLIELLDDGPDPVELVALLTRRFAPLSLANTEGEPLVICETVVAVSDPVRIRSAFDDTYDNIERSNPPRWHEHTESIRGMSQIRATLTLDGENLTVETNSEERMDRVLDNLRRLDPDSRVVEQSREPMRNPREAAQLAPPAGTPLDPDDPEAISAVEEFIREYETNWLDEAIPALDGCTPRQCAEDPTRRGDLIKLLATFPAGAAARGGMDADRLRAALGLD